MSKQNKSTPEALGAQQPCPTQNPVIQRDENEQGEVDADQILTVTEAPAVIAKGKTEDEEDTDRKLQPRPSIFDVRNELRLTTSSVSGDPIQTSSVGRAKDGRKDPRPETVPKAMKPASSAAASDTGVHSQKDPRPVPRPKAISAGTTDGQRQKNPSPTGLSGGVASAGTAAGREKKKNLKVTEFSGGTTSIDTAASWGRRKDPRPVPSPTPDIPELSHVELTPYQDSTDHPASQTTPGAVAVAGINFENSDPEPERPELGTTSDIASNIEATEDPQLATLQAPIGAHVVNERGLETGTARTTPADENVRDHLFADTLLVSAEAFPDDSENPDADVMSRKCSPRDYSRRTWAMLALFVAMIVATAALMGVLIPRNTSTADQESTQGSQQSTALSSIPTTTPSLLPSLTPTFDPETLRFRSIQSILEPISGPEVLLDTFTPQFRALEWVSLIDPLRLPYNTEAERKRVVQRYVLAVLYYASGGEYWLKSMHFLEGIHECDWWISVESGRKGNLIWAFDGGGGEVYAQGALCTKGREVGEVDHLDMSRNNLTGTLPSELQHLTALASLELEGNMFTGTIPEWFGCLTNLQELLLHENMLNGTIPPTLGQLSILEHLWLHENGLSGTIPISLGNLTSIQTLLLDHNELRGPIPSALGWLSSLNWLDLAGSSFTGKIPLELCRLQESLLFMLNVDSVTANGTEFLCECIPVEGLSGCCVVRPDELGNGQCNDDYLEPYNTEACGYDGGDCLIENLPNCIGVYPSRVGNGFCDDYDPSNTAYNTEACGYDGGDCCESTCEGLGCGINGYNCKDPTVNVTCLDADGLEGCCVEYPSQIGDGHCHLYEPHNTEVCNFDNGDCPQACPEGTSHVAGKNMSACCVGKPYLVGDGYCHGYSYNMAACGWDGGHCCEETCKGFRCGIAGYNCKDPTFNQHR